MTDECCTCGHVADERLRAAMTQPEAIRFVMLTEAIAELDQVREHVKSCVWCSSCEPLAALTQTGGDDE